MVHVSSFLLALAATANAHFLLNSPATLGFDDDNEGMAPCGGFTPSLSNTSTYHVGGDFIALTSTHPAATWLLRATLDPTASGNWTNLRPAIAQQSLGNFCETGVAVPASWAGSSGYIQIVQDATDGLLFQCAPVMFVSGMATAAPSSCNNVTGLSAAYTTDSVLSAIPAAASSTSGSMASSTAASGASMTSSGATTATSTKASAATAMSMSMSGSWWAAVGVLGAAIAFAL